MSRILPYPLLTAALLIMWILLNGLTPGQFVLGAIIAYLASFAMVPLEPSKPKIRKWSKIPVLLGRVLTDIAVSNLAVARLILKDRTGDRRSGFVTVPLKLTDPTGLALLACIVTSTPGTAWLEYDSTARTMLMHVLDLRSEAEMIASITERYEPLLLEIFE